MPEPALPADAALRQPQSLRELFLVFNRMALQGFGGVLPVAQYHVVERQRWLTKAEFLEMLSVAQVLPGPNVVNLALMIGDRSFGSRGAIAALSGMLAVPTAIVLIACALYTGYSSVPWVAGALRGMGAVSAGLVIATALKLWPGLKRNPLGRWISAAAVVATLLAIAVGRWPLVWVLACFGPPAVAAAWWRLGK